MPHAVRARSGRSGRRPGRLRRPVAAIIVAFALVGGPAAACAEAAGSPSAAASPAAVTAVSAAASPAVTGAACTDQKGVTVVVDFGPLGGIALGCARSKPKTGLDALRAAGFTATFVPGQVGFICQLDSRPDPCNGAPASAYWSYWKAGAQGRAWTYSAVGAGNDHPAAGAVEGWAFGAGDPPRFGPGASAAAAPTARTGSAVAGPPVIPATELSAIEASEASVRAASAASHFWAPKSSQAAGFGSVIRGGPALGIAVIVVAVCLVVIGAAARRRRREQ